MRTLANNYWATIEGAGSAHRLSVRHKSDDWFRGWREVFAALAIERRLKDKPRINNEDSQQRHPGQRRG
jgi:hypothetical protein